MPRARITGETLQELMDQELTDDVWAQYVGPAYVSRMGEITPAPRSVFSLPLETLLNQFRANFPDMGVWVDGVDRPAVVLMDPTRLSLDTRRAARWFGGYLAQGTRPCECSGCRSVIATQARAAYLHNACGVPEGGTVADGGNVFVWLRLTQDGIGVVVAWPDPRDTPSAIIPLFSREYLLDWCDWNAVSTMQYATATVAEPREDSQEEVERPEPPEMYECYGCGYEYRESQLFTSHYDDYDVSRCRDCHREYEQSQYEENTEGMHDYSYRPTPIFYDVTTARDVVQTTLGRAASRARQRDRNGRFAPGIADTRLFIGAELEIEGTGVRSNTKAIQLLEGAIAGYAKDDGSLGEYGFEYVTHPHTVAAWYAKRDTLTKVFAQLRKDGCRSYSTTTCGLHFHLSRSAFGGTAHVFKFMALIYHNPAFVLRLSRRTKRSLETYASLTDCSISQLPDKARAQGSSAYGRYCAVNVSNSTTVELRFFRGTLAPEGFYRAIQFTEALFRWSKDVSLEESSDLRAFRAYVTEHAKEYPELSAFVTDPATMANDLVPA